MSERRTSSPPPLDLRSLERIEPHETHRSAEDYVRQVTSADTPPVRVVKQSDQNLVYKKEIRIRYLQPPTPPPPAPIIIRERHIPPPPPESVSRSFRLGERVDPSFRSAVAHSRTQTGSSNTSTVDDSRTTSNASAIARVNDVDRPSASWDFLRSIVSFSQAVRRRKDHSTASSSAASNRRRTFADPTAEATDGDLRKVVALQKGQTTRSPSKSSATAATTSDAKRHRRVRTVES